MCCMPTQEFDAYDVKCFSKVSHELQSAGNTFCQNHANEAAHCSAARTAQIAELLIFFRGKKLPVFDLI